MYKSLTKKSKAYGESGIISQAEKRRYGPNTYQVYLKAFSRHSKCHDLAKSYKHLP